MIREFAYVFLMNLLGIPMHRISIFFSSLIEEKPSLLLHIAWIPLS